MKTSLLKDANHRRTMSLVNYRERWLQLEELGTRMPKLQALLTDLAKEYPVYV